MENETGRSEGKPSPHLQKARLAAAMDDARDGAGAGILEIEEAGAGYDAITEAAAEKGVFDIVGGWIDTSAEADLRERFTRVAVRSMGGEEEDLLGNDSVSIVERMNVIMANCVQSFASEETGRVIEDRGTLSQIVRQLPSGSRTHLLICLRRVTHWRRTKDRYDMMVRCPNRRCQVETQFTVNLADLDLFEAPDPYKRLHDFHLEDVNIDVKWRVSTGAQDEVLTILSNLSDHEVLTYMIAVRLVEWNGQDIRLGSADLLDEKKKKIKLSKRAKAVVQALKKLTVGDREDLREQFLLHEPGIDVDLDFDCPKCKTKFSGVLDVGQRTFFFPSATSRRSKRRSST